jgi:sugar phosphate isomerase/epimerase
MTWPIGIATGACMDRSILEILPAIQRSGATGVEVGTPPGHFDPWQEDQIAGARDALRASALRAVSIHAPFGGVLDLADPNPHHRHAAVGAILTAAAAIKRLGGRLVVVHPSDLERHRHDSQERLEDCLRSLTMLAESCRQEDVRLLIESPLPHLIGGHPAEFAWLLGGLPEQVGVCLDTGHTTLGCHWHDFVRITDGRLAHVHASDNRGERDDHLPPGDGRIDWHDVGRTLSAVDYRGWIILELVCPSEEPAAYFTRAFERARDLLAG